MPNRFVLVHSPLVGPFTWEPVAEALRSLGVDAIVPELRSPPDLEGEYWRHHVAAVESAAGPIGSGASLVLAGHSGAGPLLPSIADGLGGAAIGLLFVDAGLPAPGRSRLDTFPSAEAVVEFRASARGGIIAPWPEAVLRNVIPDDGARSAFVANLAPVPLSAYEERLPETPGWESRPAGYLLFSEVYRSQFEEAVRRGWPARELVGGHFHMLVDPRAVAGELLSLATQLAAGRH